MNYALVNYPDIDLSKIDAYRSKYDPGSALINAHITLMADIPTKEMGKQQLIEHLNSVISHYKPFEVSFRGVKTSPDGLLIYLEIRKGKEELTRIHKEIYSAALSQYTFPHVPYIPHVTLGLFAETDNKYEASLKEAEQARFQYSYTVTTFCLIKGDGIKPPSMVKEFLIG